MPPENDEILKTLQRQVRLILLSLVVVLILAGRQILLEARDTVMTVTVQQPDAPSIPAPAKAAESENSWISKLRET